MAQGIRFVCSSCGRAIGAWSDGNPYYIDEAGCKQYAHHPDHDSLAKCIGNDTPHLCLVCNEAFNVDSRTPTLECPKCGASDIAGTFQLSKKRCPHCKEGVFNVDDDYHCIS